MTNNKILASDEPVERIIGKDIVVTQLTELVRKTYRKYLEKQLYNNYVAWSKEIHQEPHVPKIEDVSKCAELLEDVALKSCMVTDLYRKSMNEIIASVRHKTQECRLEDNLEKLTSNRDTFSGIEEEIHMIVAGQNSPAPVESSDEHNYQLPHQKNIELLQKSCDNRYLNKRRSSCELRRRQKFQKTKVDNDLADKGNLRQHHESFADKTASENPPVTLMQLVHSPYLEQEIIQCSITNDPLEETDPIDKELAEICGENDSAEFDRIFGIEPNTGCDDPHMNKIYQEIQNSRLSKDCYSPQVTGLPVTETLDLSQAEHTQSYCRADMSHHQQLQRVNTDLRCSIWPCELYMQRCRLNEALLRLAEANLRWTEVIKDDFETLFGEDSDDEFAPCSPTFDLDDVLMYSCVRRIVPWLVKYLTPALKCGLIGNKFLFKKLVKKIGHNIITENQYPDKRIVKMAVENFFCLRQAVKSIEDLDIAGLSLCVDL